MGNAKFGMTGQNKVWLAGNIMMRALLQNDAELVKIARDTIVSEIVTGKLKVLKMIGLSINMVLNNNLVIMVFPLCQV